MERLLYRVSRVRCRSRPPRRFPDGRPRGLSECKHAREVTGKGVRAAQRERRPQARRDLNVTVGGEVTAMTEVR